MNQLLQQLTTLWGQLGQRQRLAVAGVGAAALVGLLALSLFARAPEYAVAYTNLGEQDAAAITGKLRDGNIPFELKDGGKTLRVPTSRVDEVRLQMAGQGLPTSGIVGYEIFNQQNFGMTEFTQRVNFQRALEGELSRTIQRIDAVEAARVHLVLPQQSLFTEREKQPTASVVLKLRPGRQLKPEQVRAVTHLVARSVEGLKAESVTVVDVNGMELTEEGDSDLAKLTSKQQEVRRNIELVYEKDLQNMLDRVLGPAKAVSRVKAELNWDQFEQNRELYAAPDSTGQGLVRSSKTSQETFNGQPGAQAGIPGAPSNIPQPAPGSNGNPVQYVRNEETTNRELSKTVEKLVRTPGAISRLSVGVMYDKAGATPAEVQQIEDAVVAAAGLDTKRGDTVKVTALAFDRTAIEQQARDFAQQQLLDFALSALKIVAVLIIAVLILLVLRSMLRRYALPVVPAQLPGPLAGALPGPQPVAAGAIPAAQAAAAYAQAGYPQPGYAQVGYTPAAYVPAGEIGPGLPGLHPEDLGLPAGTTDGELARIQAERQRARERRDLEAEERLRREEERLRDIQQRAQQAARHRGLLEKEVQNVAKANPEAVADLIRSWLDEEKRT